MSTTTLTPLRPWTAEEAVARGAALLDEQQPGWWDHVDLGILDINDWTRCVLAQVYANEDRSNTHRSFVDGLAALGFDAEVPIGTDRPIARDYGFAEVSASLWINAIIERRAPGVRE